MSIAYSLDCPSQSFTLRNLGSRLEQWLDRHRECIAGAEEIALDMVRLEWAEIEAFDEAAKPKLTEADLAALGDDPQLELQPYLRLLELRYPVDELLLGQGAQLPACHRAKDASGRSSLTRWRGSGAPVSG